MLNNITKNFQKWNNYLADMADDWSRTCLWQHGQPVRDKEIMPYDRVGQNLYTISNGRLDLSSATQDWYDEKPDYDFNTYPNLDEKGCVPGQMCGHYTQVHILFYFIFYFKNSLQTIYKKTVN